MGKFDETEQELEEQKKAKIEYAKKRRNTNLFLFVATIFQVVETFALMCAAFLLYLFVTYRLLKVPGSSSAGDTISAVMMLIILVGGLIVGFKIYSTCVRWFIKKYHMEDKLTQEVLNRYKKPEEEEN